MENPLWNIKKCYYALHHYIYMVHRVHKLQLGAALYLIYDSFNNTNVMITLQSNQFPREIEQ